MNAVQGMEGTTGKDYDALHKRVLKLFTTTLPSFFHEVLTQAPDVQRASKRPLKLPLSLPFASLHTKLKGSFQFSYFVKSKPIL